MSLRLRLLLATMAAAVIGLAIVDVLTYTLVTRSQVDGVDEELERAHPPIERAAEGDGDGDDDGGDGGDQDTARARAISDVAPGFYVELRDPDDGGGLVIPIRRPGEEPTMRVGGDLPVPDADNGDDEAVFTTLETDSEHDMRVRVSRQSDGSTLVIGRLLTTYEETNERLIVALLAATAGGVVVIGLVGAWLVRLGLRPLDDVERAAAEISETDLERRVPGGDAQTEIGRLATTINRMLDRLEAAFDQRERDVAALQESEATMRRFVADASHELRTPIAATAAYAELFERGARDRPEDLARAMAGIRSETGRMASLVDDLLLLAQLDEGRPLARDAVDLTDLATSAVDAAHAVAPDRAVRLRLDDVAVVTGDPVRLRQVIDNLVGNVRTHTPPDTVCLVTVRREGDDAVLTIADDGPGMGPADAERAFGRFHRADASRTRASGGAGLGLSIVAAIVEAHGGTVGLTSEAGVGTTVTVRLPIAEEER